jgi:2-methylisocitrate lyase-like PEP mutase family enzyme
LSWQSLFRFNRNGRLLRRYREGKSNGAGMAPQPVGKRARALPREQLPNGSKPSAQVKAAAEAAEIPPRSLIAATDALGVRTQRGQWWLKG